MKMTSRLLFTFSLFALWIAPAFSQAPPAWKPPGAQDSPEVRQQKLNEANSLCEQISRKTQTTEVLSTVYNATTVPFEINRNFSQFGITRILVGIRKVYETARQPGNQTYEQLHAACMSAVTSEVTLANALAADSSDGADEANSAAHSRIAAIEDFSKNCEELKRSPICDVIKEGQFEQFSYMQAIMYATEELDGERFDETEAQYNLRTKMRTIDETERAEILKNACKCAHQQLKKDEKLKNTIVTEGKKVEGIILNRLNQKFLNDFSQQFEDVSFLAKHYANSLGPSPSKFLCNSRQEFEKFAKKSNPCGLLRGPSQEERLKRIEDLFQTLPNPVSGATVSEKLSGLEEQIQVLKLPSDQIPAGAQGSYTREEFDMIRNGLSRQNPEYKGMNLVLTNIMRDPQFYNFIMSNQELSMNPRQLLQSFFLSKDSTERAKLLEGTDAAFARTLNSDFENIDENFNKHAAFVGNISPALRLLLTDHTVFSNARMKFEPGKNASNSDLATVLHNDPTLIGARMKEKCDGIKETFKQLVCGNPEKMMSEIHPDQLEDMISDHNRSQKPPQIDPDMARWSFCKNDSQNINISLSQPASSLLNRAQGKEDFFTAAMKKFAHNDTEYVRLLTSTAIAGAKESVVTQDQSFLAAISSSNFSSAPQSLIFDHVTADGRVDRNYVATNTTGGVGNTTSPAISGAAVSNVMREGDPQRSIASVDDGAGTPRLSTDKGLASNSFYSSPNDVSRSVTSSEAARETLRESLSNGKNNARVSRLVSAVPDETVTELNQLRAELAREQQKLDEVTNQTQVNKVRVLEEELRRLQAERDRVATQSPVPQNAPLAESSEFSVSGGSFNGSREASVSGTKSAGGGAAPGTEATSGGSRSLSGLNDALTGVERANAESTTPLVVTALTVRSVTEGSLDVSQEVLRFLNANDPDLTTLNQIKDNGFVYRYKVMKDGKEVVEEIFIRFDSLNDDARKKLEEKIALRRTQNPNLATLEDQVRLADRRYSYEALKLIMGQQIAASR